MKLKEIEFSNYSQNGEDGIIAHLVERLNDCSYTFVEIGCGNGKENNTTNLVHRGWNGVVFDQKPQRIQQYINRCFERVKAYCEVVTVERIDHVMKLLPSKVDVFSLDIDSYDFHIMRAMLKQGFEPKIAVLEYNCAFGGEPVTIAYKEPIVKDLFYGAGVMAWVNLMTRHGYAFVTVDSSGTNAVFLKKNVGWWAFDGIPWADNKGQQERFGSFASRFCEVSSRKVETIECLP